MARKGYPVQLRGFSGYIMTRMRTLAVTTLCLGLGLTAFALDVGKPSPPFMIGQLKGPSVPITQFKGKVVALAFIDTECPHCQHLTGVLNQLAKEYEAKGVQFVECAFNDGAEQRLPWFTQQFQPSAMMGFSARDPVMTYLSHSILRPLYVPHLVFLDRNGLIQGDFPGESDFMTNPEKNIPAKLDEILKASPATSTHPAHKSAGKSTAAVQPATPSHP